MNKCIVVCGTSRGIGKAILSHLSMNPELHILALSRDITALAEMYADNQRVTLIPFDLTLPVEPQLNEQFKEIKAIHGLINNAGYLEQGTAETLSIEAYHRCMQTNFFGLCSVEGSNNKFHGSLCRGTKRQRNSNELPVLRRSEYRDASRSIPRLCCFDQC
jgi:short-subunit dehydrogenase